MDHPKGFKERVDDIHHQQEKGGRRQQRQNDCEEPSPEAGTVNRSRLDHRTRHRLQCGEEEQEIIADAPPGRGHNNKTHGLAAIQDMVPLIPDLPQIPGDNANARVEHEQPQHPGNRRRHGIGPYQQCAIGAGTLDEPVGKHRKKQRWDQGAQRNQNRKHCCGQE
ncbi:MAG: Uncharacterised protein [SAR116 cluster bacterium]|nr:MAG: Uncharacterised protein [SAR116 cluster bacterium]